MAEKQTAPSGQPGAGNDDAAVVSAANDSTKGASLSSLLRGLELQAPKAGQAARAALAREFAQEPAADWPIYTLADAYAPRPPLEYVVAGLFLLGSLSVVYGAPGCFKSLLLADLAVCVAAGLPWLPPLPGKDDVIPRATRSGPVLWLDFDNGRRRTDERLEALARARDLPEATPLYYCSMPSPWLDAGNPASMLDLSRRILSLSASLVLVDNLGNVCGKTDENSVEMASVMAGFRRVAEDTGAALVLIHHQRKTTGVRGRAGESLRGHSSIEASLDLALLIGREEGSGEVQARSTKVRGIDVFPFGARFAYTHRPGTDELAEARFFGLPVEDLVSDVAAQRYILEMVGANPNVCKADLVDRVKTNLPDIGVNRVRHQVEHLVSTGALVMTRGAKNAKLYTLPGEREQAPLAF